MCRLCAYRLSERARLENILIEVMRNGQIAARSVHQEGEPSIFSSRLSLLSQQVFYHMAVAFLLQSQVALSGSLRPSIWPWMGNFCLIFIKPCAGP